MMHRYIREAGVIGHGGLLSIFFHSPDKGLWLWDLTQTMRTDTINSRLCFFLSYGGR